MAEIFFFSGDLFPQEIKKKKKKMCCPIVELGAYKNYSNLTLTFFVSKLCEYLSNMELLLRFRKYQIIDFYYNFHYVSVTALKSTELF